MRRFLWRPDPVSAKDWNADALLVQARVARPALPTSIRLDTQIPDILDQGNLGSCGANALAQAIRANLLRQNVAADKIAIASRCYLYYMARAASGTISTDSGVYFRGLLDAAKQVGYPAERFWPYDDGPTTFRIPPDAAAVRAAHDQLTGFTYHRITSTDARRSHDLRSLLATGRPIIFGTMVTGRFASYKLDSTPLDAPRANDPILGGHGLLLAGYGSGYFDVVNSWGPSWGKNGWCQMTDAYIENWRSADFWVLDNVRPFSEV